VGLSNGRPFGPLALLDRLRLRSAALRYAQHGWAVTPGACLDGARFACGRAGCPIMGCHPEIESWEDHASTDPARIRAWWRDRPHAVLLATGWRFDAIEVPAALARRALAAGATGPVLATPSGRWTFLVRPGLPLRAELRHRLDVVRHGRGSWIPAAPSRMPDGPVQWTVPPDAVQWRLPTSASVQAKLIEALGSPVHHPVVAVPRQMSTARRAA
jgi:hypothetical protein